MGQGNPKGKYRLGGAQTKSSPVENDWGVLVDEKLRTTWQNDLAVLKANCILSCVNRSVASRSSHPAALPLMRAHLQGCVQPWCPQHKTGRDLLAQAQWKAMKMI